MKKVILFTLILIQLFICNYNSYSQGYLRIDGKKIVKSSGEEILLKGIGLGGWLLHEGYMLQMSGFANSQTEIRNKIESLIGVENSKLFYTEYYKNYVTKGDIDKIAEWGFNSIRLPFHYAILTHPDSPDVYSDYGFGIIDSVLSWCGSNQLYLILDMHAAPGGQSDEPISDYNPLYPSLWESVANQQRTVNIWKKIAERYSNKTWIAGYDLLNEPKWDLGPNNVPLRNLYIQITNAIRSVDTNHIIFIEGNWFATDFSGLTPPWDSKLVYSFHKYWNSNTTGAIQYLLNLRETTNVPLWLGESGENSNVWFTECIQLMNSNKIGWAWWPHKKIESISGPLSAVKTPEYQVLLNYWNGQGPKPTAAYATNALVNQAKKLAINNCIIQSDVIDALMRQPYTDQTKIWMKHNIPGLIFATDYDLGKINYAYKDNTYQNTGGSNSTWNSGWSYRNDGVDIEKCSDGISNGYNVGWIESGEWLNYTVTVNHSGTYDIVLRAAANQSGGKVLFRLNSINITPVIDIPSTGGWQNWHDIFIENVYLPQGEHKLQLVFFFGGFNINYFEFVTKTVGVSGEEDTFFPNKLYQNYPNPFNPTTVISWQLPIQSHVTLKVYDILGREVTTLVDEVKEAGIHNSAFRIPNSELASGVYFYELKAGSFRDMRKMIVLK
ncbi:MAG: cellulase family glycosylhydrolase [Bacteroidetes bacterium]|nr:cellulase family glycosylhydrolase [Bacteroidota bacterium]MBU2585889.1 cellulase family glycosylhydrolase [Bacteroidota bacterium]